MIRSAALALALVPAASAAAVEPIDAGWSEVARARDGNCALVVTGNGQFYRVAASGLEPGAGGRFVLTNGDMKPLDWDVRADGAGRFARYYLPFRWHRAGGTVEVALESARCTVSAAFDWRRADVTVR